MGRYSHVINCPWPLPTACGGVLSGSGQIRTPYHPNSYPHDKTCEWVINQPQGSVVTLTFLAFDVEGNSECLFDYVEVTVHPLTFPHPILQTPGNRVV